MGVWRVDKKSVAEVVKKEVKDRVIRDENLVFLGDSLFYFYDLDEYFPKNKVVNSGINGNTTTDILDSMYNRVYRYNPSKVFLLIGTNNLQKDVSMEDTFSEMKEIIKGIKDNRKMANVYVISLLPINDNEDEKKIDMKVVGKRTNEDIKKINKEYKKICEENKVAFIDIFNKFTDDDGRMNIDYTKEGLHLSDEGYELLTECLKKYINK